MTDYEDRLVIRIKALLVQLGVDAIELTNKLEVAKFDECLAISTNLNYLALEIIRLNRKLTSQHGE